GKNELDSKTDLKVPIRVVDLLDPDRLVLALLRNDSTEPVAPTGPIVLTAAKAGADEPPADPTAAALFTHEVVIRYETPLSQGRHGLVVPLLSGDAASGLSTNTPSKVDVLTRRGQIRDAFLPVRSGVSSAAQPFVAAIPSWLFKRLRSVSLNAVAEEPSFC